MSEEINKNTTHQSNTDNAPETPKKKGFRLGKQKKDLNIYQEEQIQTPWRTVLKTYASNKLSMTALIAFIIIAVFMFVAPYFFVLDLGYNEPMQANLPPSINYMDYPDAMKTGARDISVGSSFSVGIDQDGNFHAWGDIEQFAMPNLMASQPEGMTDLVKIAAGFDHVLALDSQGQVWAWGNSRNGQTRIPRSLDDMAVKDIYAGYKFSLIVTEDGYTEAWGNTMNFDYNNFHAHQGQVDEVAMTTTVVTALLNDGTIAYLGTQRNSYTNVPEGVFTDIAATALSFAAIREDGEVVDWGNRSYRRGDVMPEFEAVPVALDGGMHHYSAILEDGSIETWGKNDLRQRYAPDVDNATAIEAGYFQNYYQTEDGTLESFGKNGYPLGTDDFGRDVFTRLVNGGRLSLTIGILAVIISTGIGMILGGISGYFGGKVDMFIQRFSEIVNSFPFLPTVILLNSIWGDQFTSTQRVYLIMVLLGLLGWTGLMRLIRAQVLSLREQEFVTAARALGIKEMGIVFQHIIPNVISIIIVSATLNFAGYLLYEATLSFLGFGVQPPQPTWGNMLFGANNSTVIQNFWWRWVFPATILSICIICINLIGTGLDDAVDPKSQER